MDSNLLGRPQKSLKRRWLIWKHLVNCKVLYKWNTFVIFHFKALESTKITKEFFFFLPITMLISTSGLAKLAELAKRLVLFSLAKIEKQFKSEPLCWCTGPFLSWTSLKSSSHLWSILLVDTCDACWVSHW